MRNLLNHTIVQLSVRMTITLILLLLVGCGDRFVGDFSQHVTRNELLSKAEFVFVGTIQEQHVESAITHRVILPGSKDDLDTHYRVVRHKVSVETLLRGSLPKSPVDVYEVSWFGRRGGDWNAVRSGDRYLFLVKSVGGRLRVVRDYWRSIFPVVGGPYQHVPLSSSRPMWERVALMNFDLWNVHDLARTTQVDFFYADPGHALSDWRWLKLLRGLLRHPSSEVRVSACREILRTRSGEDGCWSTLSATEKQQTRAHGSVCCTEEHIQQDRGRIMERSAEWWWSVYGQDREGARALTAVNIPERRAEICALWNKHYPDDRDSGCHLDGTLPATRVTQEGDLPVERATGARGTDSHSTSKPVAAIRSPRLQPRSANQRRSHHGAFAPHANAPPMGCTAASNALTPSPASSQNRRSHIIPNT